MFTSSQIMLRQATLVFPRLAKMKNASYFAFLKETLDLPENQEALMSAQKAQVDAEFEAQFWSQWNMSEAESKTKFGEVCDRIIAIFFVFGDML